MPQGYGRGCACHGERSVEPADASTEAEGVERSYLVRVRSTAFVLDPHSGILVLRPGQVVPGELIQTGDNPPWVQISVARINYRFDSTDVRISLEPMLTA